MERKQWMENARDKVPAVTGLVFLLLCLWLTWAVALPFWQNGQKRLGEGGRSFAAEGKSRSLCQAIRSRSSQDKTKKHGTVYHRSRSQRWDGSHGKNQRTGRKNPSAGGGLPSPGNGEEAGSSAHGAYLSGGLCSAPCLFPPVERGDASGLLGNRPY